MTGGSGDRKGEPILLLRGVEGRLADCRFTGSNFAICCRTCRSSRDRSASACCNSLRNFPNGLRLRSCWLNRAVADVCDTAGRVSRSGAWLAPGELAA